MTGKLLLMTRQEFDLLTPAEILRLLPKRYKLLSELVGKLYPPMLEAEIEVMRCRYTELTGEPCPI